MMTYNKDYDNFEKNFTDSEQESFKQIKSNIEFLFKGAEIFSHFAFFPLKVLRWQCQIHSESLKCHFTPVTLIPVFYNLTNQGFSTLWKGCFSMASYNGIKFVLESFILELEFFGKNSEYSKKPFDVNKLMDFFISKSIPNILTSPIYSAAIYESVQSIVSNQNFGIIDLLRETWNRVSGFKSNYRARLIPFWSLVLPTTSYFVGFHLISYGMKGVFRKFSHIYKKVFDENRRIVDHVEETLVESPFTNSSIDLAAQISATLAMYPIETVLNRLIVQGTRTIIDNTDTGYGVVPINTRYEGFFDCIRVMRANEGIKGFYKGLGTIFIQATLQYLLLKLTKAAAIKIYESQWSFQSDMSNVNNLMISSNKPNIDHL